MFPPAPNRIKTIWINGIGAVTALLYLGACTPTPLTDNGNQVNFSSALNFELPVQSLTERRFQTVIHQQYDFSCGSAALATLLTYHYGDRQNEKAIFLGMWRHGNQKQIRKLGFSLLDMKRYLAGRGIGSDGYRVSLAQIMKAKTPGIALINYRGYKHFVVLKGIKSGKVMVGDPALGIRLVSLDAFQKSWNGVFFIIKNRAVHGAFNQTADWELAPVARFTHDAPMSLQALALTRPLPGEL